MTGTATQRRGSDRPSRRRTTVFLLAGLLISLLLAGIVSGFASGSPDGLDSATLRGCTVDDDGEITGGDCPARRATDHELGDSPLADYGIGRLGDGRLSTGLAGVVGVLVTFGAGALVFRLAGGRPGTHTQRR